MKKLLIIFLLSIPLFLFAQQSNNDCFFTSLKTGKSIPLNGKVRVVTSNADFKVQIVSHFPTLKVEKVNTFPNNCGQWLFVDSFEDFTIQYVEHFPNFTIQFVNNFPGIK